MVPLLAYEKLTSEELRQIVHSQDATRTQVYWALRACACASNLPKWLIPFLEHEDSWYRQGALLGVEPHVDESLLDWLEKIAAIDESDEVRETCEELFGDLIHRRG